QAANCGNLNYVIGHFGVFAHQQRAKDIVDQAYDQNAVKNQDNSKPDFARYQKVGGDRQPDYRGPYRRQQREQRHDYAPEQRTLYAKDPEDQSAQGTLGGRDHDVSFQGGAHDGNELVHKQLLMFGAKWNDRRDSTCQGCSVTQQEEQQIQHDAQSDQKLGCVLPYVDGLRGEEFAALKRSRRQLLLNAEQVGQTELFQGTVKRRRQRSDDLFEIRAEIQLAAFDSLVQVGTLLQQ